MSSYGDFAEFYDILMCDVDYSARTEYLLQLFERFGRKPGLMLDLACGTGSMSMEFAARGVDVIGVDRSDNMLSKAGQKAALNGRSILFLCQDAAELDLYGTVDSAICTLDSLNHITDYPTLCRIFSRVSLFLESGCLFIFDVNTAYKHREVLADNTFVFDYDNIYCVWQNEYKKQHDVVNISLDFFAFNGKSYDRYSEDFSERAYSDEELKSAADTAGLKMEAVFADMSFDEPFDHCERKIFVMRKM